MASTFTYNGTALSTYGLYCAEGNDPWVPPPVIQKAGAPVSGYRFAGQGYGPGSIVLPCYVKAADLATLRTYRDSIAITLDVTLGAKKLSIESIPTRYWLAMLDSTVEAPQRAGFNTRFDLTFALEGHAYDTVPVIGGSTINANPYSQNVTAPAGSAPANVAWFIRNTTGAAVTTNFKIDSTTIGEYIQWYGTIPDGYWLKCGSLDSDGRFVYSLELSTGGGANPVVLTYVNAKSGVTNNGGDWPRLKVAVSNTVTITGLSAGTLYYVYYPRYVGA